MVKEQIRSFVSRSTEDGLPELEPVKAEKRNRRLVNLIGLERFEAEELRTVPKDEFLRLLLSTG